MIGGSVVFVLAVVAANDLPAQEQAQPAVESPNSNDRADLDSAMIIAFWNLVGVRFLFLSLFSGYLAQTGVQWVGAKLIVRTAEANLLNSLRVTTAVQFAGPFLMIVLGVPVIIIGSYVFAGLTSFIVIVLGILLSIFLMACLITARFFAGNIWQTCLLCILSGGVVSIVATPLALLVTGMTLPSEERKTVQDLHHYLSYDAGKPLPADKEAQWWARLERLKEDKGLRKRIEVGDYTQLSLRQRIEVRQIFQKRSECLREMAAALRNSKDEELRDQVLQESRRFKEQYTQFKTAMKQYTRGGTIDHE